MGNPFTVSLVGWHDGEPLLRSIREAVFIHEQGVPDVLEWDGLDEISRHALALSLQGDAVGCGRMQPDGHIGHIAVLPQWRKQKVGTAILEALLDHARAQHYAQASIAVPAGHVSFFQGLGFTGPGETIMIAGLPHVQMLQKL